MHNNALILCTIIFAFAMIVLVGATIVSISNKQAAHVVLIEDQPLKVLNTIDGVEGPALYTDERIRTSLYNCNKTNHEISVQSNGVFKNAKENTIIVIDPATVARPSGCETTLRMSPGSAKDRGLTPGTWKIEGSRTVVSEGEIRQTITFTSEEFKVLAR